MHVRAVTTRASRRPKLDKALCKFYAAERAASKEPILLADNIGVKDTELLESKANKVKLT